MIVLRQLRNGLYRTVGRVDSLLSQMQKGPSEGWVTFVLLLLSVLMTVWSLGSAQWAPTPGLYGLALLAVLVGLVLAKMPFRGWLLAISGLLLGVLLSFFQLTGLVEAAVISDRFAEVGNRLFVWGRAFVGGDVNPESLLVSLFLLLTLWLAGFMCSWSFFRKHNILGAVLPSGLVMIVNLTILPPGAQRLPLYLYLLIVCLLVGRLFVLEREHDWNQRSVQRRQLDSLLVPKAFRLALMVVIVTAILPAPSAEIAPVAAVWDRISSPVRTMTDEFAGVARGVSSKGSAFDNSFGETSPFRASTTLEEEPVLIVEAPFPVHLRARSYDLYTHTGWETGETQMVSPELSAEQKPDQESQKSRQIEVSAKVMFSLTAGEPIYLGGYPVDMSIDYQLEVLQPARYQIALLGSCLLYTSPSPRD